MINWFQDVYDHGYNKMKYDNDLEWNYISKQLTPLWFWL